MSLDGHLAELVEQSVARAVAPLALALRDLALRYEQAQAAAVLLPTATAAALVGLTGPALRMRAQRDPAVAAARVGRGRGARWDRARLLAAVGGKGAE